jgi:CYTH domain-containing protein
MRLWPATQRRRLEKTRYQGSLGHERAFELDIFLGRLPPLILVEVEFSAVKAAIDFTEIALINVHRIDFSIGSGVFLVLRCKV